MEVYLRQDTDIIRFPITPSVISVNGGANMDTSNIIRLGEIGVFNGRKLQTIDLKSLFPAQEYSACNWRGFADPYTFVKKIKKWKDNGHLLRITATGTDVNFECKISDFTYSEQDGTRDVYFELSLVEHIRINIPSTANNNNSTNNSNRPSNPTSSSVKTHKVVNGDNLWDIAYKYYGKGSNYPKLKQKNWDKYPSLKKDNYINSGWVLVI